jgi:hypothetical protein
MPMDFPDNKSLQSAAKTWKFRAQSPEETDADYRKALARFVLPYDRIEAFEILFGVGWDRWNNTQKMFAISGGIE